MTKVLRTGQIDPDHALAEWFFSIRFPVSGSWPPFLPEPPDTPWRWHLFEMPDGGITGIGLDQGTVRRPPPNDLPADWIQQLVPTARAQISRETFANAANTRPADVDNTGAMTDAPLEEEDCPAAFGLDNEAPCEEAEIIDNVFEEADEEPPARAPQAMPNPPAPSNDKVPFAYSTMICGSRVATLFCLGAYSLFATAYVKWLGRKGTRTATSFIPCFGKTLEVLNVMSFAEAFLVATAFEMTTEARIAFATLALAAFLIGLFQFYVFDQVPTCWKLIRAASVLGLLGGTAVRGAAITAMGVSAAAIVAVAWTGGATTIEGIIAHFEGST
jgi:hypothetical protein